MRNFDSKLQKENLINLNFLKNTTTCKFRILWYSYIYIYFYIFIYKIKYFSVKYKFYHIFINQINTILIIRTKRPNINMLALEGSTGSTGAGVGAGG